MASILLIDDDEMMSRLMSLRLARQGHRVELAADGRQGIRQALRGRHDLVLMDLQMPVMDGLETVRQLRAQGYRSTIVAVTACDRSREVQAALDAGCDRFLSKPIGEDFETRIADILSAIDRRADPQREQPQGEP